MKRSAATVVLLTVTVATAAAQTPAGAQAYAPPRAAFGHPDLQGIWQVVNTAAWDIQDHGASLGVPAGRGVVEGNDIPYQPWALEKKQQHSANRATLDPDRRCLLSGVPRITYVPYPFQIVQQVDKVNILYEYNHTLRHIYMNGNPHPEGPIEWWMGDSRGRWEGNTLVVDTIHFTAETWFDKAGHFHSEQLHVVERFTRTGPDHMLYEVTIEDPKVFTRPWKMSMPLYRRVDADAEILEYECYAYLLEEIGEGVFRAFPIAFHGSHARERCVGADGHGRTGHVLARHAQAAGRQNLARTQGGAAAVSAAAPARRHTEPAGALGWQL